MNQGGSYEEFDIKDGKGYLYIVFGANRWEFEKLDEEGEHLPEFAESCLERLRTTTMYLLRHWKHLHAEDRAMGTAGLTQDIEGVKSCGYAIKGTKSYLQAQGEEDARKYRAFLRIVKDGED